MTFDTHAKELLRTKGSPQSGEKTLEKANALFELANAGFSLQETFQEIRSLYDNCEDDAIRRQLLDMIVKMHGVYKEAESKQAPTFIFNVHGDKNKIDQMLCPPHPAQASGEESCVN